MVMLDFKNTPIQQHRYTQGIMGKIRIEMKLIWFETEFEPSTRSSFGSGSAILRRRRRIFSIRANHHMGPHEQHQDRQETRQ